jgi:AcrR family transcriptional regulator
MGRRANDNKVIPLHDRKPDANKEKLLRAAQNLFSAQGLAGTQIAQITGEAGTGISMFYRYFKDKNDLLQNLIETFLNELDLRLADALEGVERQSPMEQLFSIRKVFHHVIGHLVSRPDLTVMLYRAGFGADEKTEMMIRGRISKVALDVAAHITRAEEAGVVIVKQKEVLGHAVTGLALQVANKLIADREPDLDEAVDVCTRFTLGGLLVFCPPATFNQIFPAVQFMLQPTPGVVAPLNSVAKV